MKHSDFSIGDQFVAGPARQLWQVTDVGTRVIVAVQFIDGWMAGPPYALDEVVFDENDMPVCERETR